MNVLTVQWAASTYALLCFFLVTIGGLVGLSNPRDTTDALARHTQTEVKHVVPISKDRPGAKAHARFP